MFMFKSLWRKLYINYTGVPPRWVWYDKYKGHYDIKHTGSVIIHVSRVSEHGFYKKKHIRMVGDFVNQDGLHS